MRPSLQQIPRPNNSGIVRYVLALLVVVAHFKGLARVDASSTLNYLPSESHLAVGGFFALSGFLITGSLMRRASIKQFLISRARRILPAYMATVILFAVILYFFSATQSSYFTSGHFWRYLASNLCFANFIEPTLPGVFGDNPAATVNGSLWTMKVEWMLYLSLPLTLYLIFRKGEKPSRIPLILTGIYLFSVLWSIICYSLYEQSGREIYIIMQRQFFGQLTYFYSGVFIYYYLDRFMRYKWLIFCISAVVVALAYFLPYIDIVLMPAAVTSLILVVSMSGNWGHREDGKENLSYNIYLVHFPVIQICLSLALVELAGVWGAFICVLLLTTLVSLFINRVVEMPLKRHWHKRKDSNHKAGK